MNSTLLIVVGIHLMALVSPGPDFFLVLRYAMRYDMHKSLLCICGIICGIVTHISLIYFGIAFFIQRSPLAYNIVVVLGILWLVRIAFAMIFAKAAPKTASISTDAPVSKAPFVHGYLTNLLNPKVFIYFTSIVTPFLSSADVNFILLLAVFTTTSFVWFTAVSLLLFIPIIKKRITAYTFILERVFGVVLLLMALLLFKLVVL